MKVGIIIPMATIPTIFLYGPPASGKTTLGGRLADALGARFIDLDAEIERRAGRPVAGIFQESGEAAFRRLESATLREVAPASPGRGVGPLVVALGGGTLLDPANRAYAEAAGRVWCLATPPEEEIARRIALRPGSRPLGDKARERAPHYASFRSRVAASFDLGNSLVVVGSALGAPAPLAKFAVADANAARLHPAALDPGRTFAIPSGEAHKDIATVQSIWRALHGAGIGRRDCVLALGGGVTGDLTGFAAATWMRGVTWLNAPTTLLSMVDASTGGKTGFDLPEGKNLVGAFHPPALVIVDSAYLATLPPRELASGQAEMIKHEIISGALRPSVSSLPTAAEIAANLSVKVEIVRRDPLETQGLRVLLNCGH
ncbi:MAG: hypothetical protein IJP66_02915, partial [Kiritimatiellae bacterium]|nr:hypothetical protein [Kiritimatiellia bacterium]